MLKTAIVLGVSFVMNMAMAADAVVPYTDAAKYYNQTKTIEGTVAGTFCNDKMCFLNFHKEFKKFVSAVIMASDFAKFSKVPATQLQAELDKMYTGKKVQVTGMLTEYKSKSDGVGRPQLNLTDSANVKVITK
jgi:hypothetical protein